MKTLEKKELKTISGGYKHCEAIAINVTYCHYGDGVQNCYGLYTWGGDTIGGPVCEPTVF